MIRCTIHTSHWWKWTLSCIVSWLLTIVTYHWSSTSSKASSLSSSTSVASSIPSRSVILRLLVIVCGIKLRLHSVVWLLCSVVLGWYLIKMGFSLPNHHFFMYPICIWCSLPHQLHGSTIFFIMAYWIAKVAIRALWGYLVLLHHWEVIWIVALFLTYFPP